MILVSILGDFHSSVLPVYFQFKKKLTSHIIIYDDFKSDVDEAKNIIKGTKDFNKKYNINIKTYTYCIDEDNYNALEEAVSFIKKQTKKYNKLFINTTDGLSNINTIIGLNFIPLGANILSYDRYDNEVNIIVNKTMTTYKVDKIIPIKDHFLLRNIQVEKTSNKKYVNKYKTEILTLFENEYEEFKSFAKYVQVEDSPTLNNSKYKKVNKILKRLDLLGNIKSNQGFITGTLFEYYIYLKIKKLDFDDIELGVVVRRYIDKTNFIPNEFDILIMKENHLHMIECKFTKNVKLDTLVYKYMGLKSLLDDDGKICIVTGHKNPKDIHLSTNPVEYHAHKRALSNKIYLRGNPIKDIDKFVQELKTYFQI